MKNVSIVGFGRFGKTLYRLIKDNFDVCLYDLNRNAFTDLPAKDQRLVTSDLTKVFQSDVIFYAVPISEFENVIRSHKKYFRDDQLLIDVLSVKVHPKKVFEKYLKDTKTQALLTHPMFGPDSSKQGFSGLPIVLDQFTSSYEDYKFWKNYFINKGLKVVELTAKEHDKLSAKSQALAHYIGRGLLYIDHQKTQIDTKGAELLTTLMDLTTGDSKELFYDMHNYNPYTKIVRNNFIKAMLKINKLLQLKS